MCFLPKSRENLVKGKEKIVQLRNIKRGAILRIVGLITAHSSPDIYLISLTTKIVYG
jgi:primosomal replication protein N